MDAAADVAGTVHSRSDPGRAAAGGDDAAETDGPIPREVDRTEGLFRVREVGQNADRTHWTPNDSEFAGPAVGEAGRRCRQTK